MYIDQVIEKLNSFGKISLNLRKTRFQELTYDEYVEVVEFLESIGATCDTKLKELHSDIYYAVYFWEGTEISLSVKKKQSKYERIEQLKAELAILESESE
jgi:hypothetical protein